MANSCPGRRSSLSSADNSIRQAGLTGRHSACVCCPRSAKALAAAFVSFEAHRSSPAMLPAFRGDVQPCPRSAAAQSKCIARRRSQRCTSRRFDQHKSALELLGVHGRDHAEEDAEEGEQPDMPPTRVLKRTSSPAVSDAGGHGHQRPQQFQEVPQGLSRPRVSFLLPPVVAVSVCDLEQPCLTLTLRLHCRGGSWSLSTS